MILGWSLLSCSLFSSSMNLIFLLISALYLTKARSLRSFLRATSWFFFAGVILHRISSCSPFITISQRKMITLVCALCMQLNWPLWEYVQQIYLLRIVRIQCFTVLGISLSSSAYTAVLFLYEYKIHSLVTDLTEQKLRNSSFMSFRVHTFGAISRERIM